MAKRSNILRASVISAVGTGLARLLGAVRDIAIGHVFGAGRSADSFWLAWTVPSVFRRFVADEGLTGALIPAVAQTEAKGGTQKAKEFAGAALLAMLLASVVIVIAGMLAAPWLVRIFAPGFGEDPEKWELTVSLTRWLFPFVIFVSLVSFCEGLLNHRGHFFVPKVAPGLVSGCIAVSALLVATKLEEPIFALVIGVLVGGLAHLLICVPVVVAKWGMVRPSLTGFREPPFRLFLVEIGKVAAIGISAQINVAILRILASYLDEGAVTQYWYANRVVDLAQGAIAVAVGSALLPAIAKDVALRDWSSFRKNISDAVGLVGIVLLPAAGFLVAMAEPIVSMLFRHGAFDKAAALQCAATLRLLVPFMLALAGINILKKVYFALDDRTTLLVVGALGMGLTGGLGYLFSSQLGVRGLGAALSLSVALQLVVYLVVLRRQTGTKLGLAAAAKPLVKLTVAAGPAALVAFLICQWGDWPEGPALVRNWLVFGAAGFLAMLVYLAGAWVLRVRELRWLLRRVGLVQNDHD